MATVNILEVCKRFNRSERLPFIMGFEQAGGKIILIEDLEVFCPRLDNEQIEWLLKMNKKVLKKLCIIASTDLGNIFKVIKECEVLKDLNIIISDITGEQLKYIMNTAKSVVSLNIGGSNKLTKKGLMSALRCDNNITSLNLSYVAAVDDEVLLECSQFQQLEVGKTDITANGFIDFAKNSGHVKYIDVTKTSLLDDAINAAADIFEQKQQAVEIKVDDRLKPWMEDHDYQFVKFTFVEEY